MAKELSSTMRAAVLAALAAGGELVRWPGGFWLPAGVQFRAYAPGTFSAATVNALVLRGCAQYVEYREGRAGRFPVRARIVDAVRPLVGV